MRRITLAPICYYDEWAAPLEREILAYFDEVIFAPIRGILPEMRVNETDALKLALLAGTVAFVENEFRGSFNAGISKELRRLGAVRTINGFKFLQGTMPVPLRAFLAEITLRNEGYHTEIDRVLEAMLTAYLLAPTGIQTANTVDKVVSGLQTQFVKSVSGVEGLEAPAPLPEGFVSDLQDQVRAETDFAIRNFTLQQINELRSAVQRNAREGGRADRLHELIESQYGVAKRKARVIAEAETSLATARFRRDRYASIGITQYVWETSHDERVRPTHGESNNHRDLDGRTFSWDDPPIVDRATGRRRHPGEDYGPCRCLARPVLNLV